jgi:pimeloyl-ACP methyl ester carboxylesterase
MPATDTRTLSTWGDLIHPRVQIAGEGPPLVFLHGAAGLAWDDFLDDLTQSFTVYAPEHPGTTPGDPDGVKPLDDLWDLVLCYYELFDDLGLESPAVIGHSFGGMVAAEVAATNPQRVSKLVLLNPIGLWRDDAPVPNYMVMTPEQLAERLFVEPEGPVATQMLGMPEDPDEQADAMLHFTWSLACTGKFVWPTFDRGLVKRLHRITAPTLIVWGHRDGLVSSVYADEFASRIADSRVEVLENAAHVPQLEQRDETVRLVTEFLGA